METLTNLLTKARICEDWEWGEPAEEVAVAVDLNQQCPTSKIKIMPSQGMVREGTKQTPNRNPELCSKFCLKKRKVHRKPPLHPGFCRNTLCFHTYVSESKIRDRKVPQRNCVTKILPNVRVNFLARFASKPLFYWVVTGNPLGLFRKFFGAVRAFFGFVGPFWLLVRCKPSCPLTPTCTSVVEQLCWS